MERPVPIGIGYIKSDPQARIRERSATLPGINLGDSPGVTSEGGRSQRLRVLALTPSGPT